MLFRCLMICGALAALSGLAVAEVRPPSWPILCARIPALNVSIDQLSGGWHLLEAYYFYLDGPRSVSVSNGTSQICVRAEVSSPSSLEMSMAYNFTFVNKNKTRSYRARFRNLGDDLGRWNVQNATQQVGAEFLVIAADPERFFVSAECQVTSTRPPKKYARTNESTEPSAPRTITFFNYLIGVNVFTRRGSAGLEVQEVAEIRSNVAALLGLSGVQPTQYSTSC